MSVTNRLRYTDVLPGVLPGGWKAAGGCPVSSVMGTIWLLHHHYHHQKGFLPAGTFPMSHEWRNTKKPKRFINSSIETHLNYCCYWLDLIWFDLTVLKLPFFLELTYFQMVIHSQPNKQPKHHCGITQDSQACCVTPVYYNKSGRRIGEMKMKRTQAKYSQSTRTERKLWPQSRSMDGRARSQHIRRNFS